MKKIKGISPVTKAVGVFSAVAIIAGGVTYAALQSQATLSDNTISSATAALQVNNLENGGSFTSEDAGFQFTGLVPGGGYSPAQQFVLKNSGDANLQVTVFSDPGEGTSTLDKSKVHVKFTNKSLSTPGWVEYTLAQLEDGQNGLPGVVGDDFLDTSTPGEANEFDIQVKLDSDAVTGESGGTITGFDLVFTGTAYTVPETPDVD